MFAALMLAAQVTMGQPVATCRVPNDPQQRVWSLERAGTSWLVAFSAKSLDKPRVELPLFSDLELNVNGLPITVAFATANGGRFIEWKIHNGPSTLDLRVNHGLEINVVRDLDPAVEYMNTDGVLAVECSIATRAGRGPDRAREWQVGAGIARSVNLFESTSGRSYVVQTIGWARELTGDLRILRIPGRFAWGVEAMPLFAQLEPTRIYGVGVAPVVWRWNFPPRPSWSIYGELSMGGMWSSAPIPEKTTRGNFTAHWGGGVRLRPRGRHALLIAYRFQHFSNGNQLGSNPGVNSHVLVAGWSHRS